MKFTVLNVAEFNKVLDILYDIGDAIELCKVKGKLNMIAADHRVPIYSRVIFHDNMFGSIRMEDEFHVKIDIRNAVKVMKAYRDFDELTVEFEDVQLDFEGKKNLSKKKIRNSLYILGIELQTLKLIDGFTDENRVKDYLVEIEIGRETLEQALLNAELYSSDVTFSVESDLIKIKSEGAVGNMEHVIGNDELKIKIPFPRFFEPFEMSFKNKIVQKALVGGILKLRMHPKLLLSIGIFSEFYDLFFTIVPLQNNK